MDQVYDWTKDTRDYFYIGAVIPDWQAIGEEDEEGGARAILLGTAYLLEVPHHVTAYRVEERNDVQHPLQREDTFDAIYAAEGAEGPWQTVEIYGEPYVLVVTPFCD